MSKGGYKNCQVNKSLFNEIFLIKIFTIYLLEVACNPKIDPNSKQMYHSEYSFYEN